MYKEMKQEDLGVFSLSSCYSLEKYKKNMLPFHFNEEERHE